MKVCLEFLGCRLNEAELQGWGNEFSQKGLSLTTDPKSANLLVLNTCAVTGEAARKSRQALRRLHRNNPQAKLVATGCYASLEPEKVAQVLGVDLVVENLQKSNLVDYVAEQLSLPTMPNLATEPGESAIFSRNRDRAFIKVQDGCRYRCTYCIVTVARGDESSRSIEELVQEISQHHRYGIREIVLTGVHVGGYGSDTGSNLYDLVKAILARTEIQRLRFASVEPWDLPDEFFDLFDDPRVLPHMHLPLQSGSDPVLRRMSRRCRTDEFKRLIELAREKVPDFNVTTDIIVGFPGETEEEWNETVEFVQTIGFGHIHIFSFSAREGTKAARLPNHLNSETKKLRSKQLHQIAAQSRIEQLKKQLGLTVRVLLESDYDSPDGSGLDKTELDEPEKSMETQLYRFWGHTPNYHKISLLSPDKSLAGKIVEVELEHVNEQGAFIETRLKSILADPTANLAVTIC